MIKYNYAFKKYEHGKQQYYYKPCCGKGFILVEHNTCP